MILNKKVCNLSVEIKPNICADGSAMNYWEDWMKGRKITWSFSPLMFYFAPHFGTGLWGLFLSRRRFATATNKRMEFNGKRSHKTVISGSTDYCCTNGFLITATKCQMLLLSLIANGTIVSYSLLRVYLTSKSVARLNPFIVAVCISHSLTFACRSWVQFIRRTENEWNKFSVCYIRCNCWRT